MALRFIIVLLLSVYSIELGMAIPAFPVTKCGPNAEFQNCGSACAPDCANPKQAEHCTMQCVIGCFCNEGFLKNTKGECVLPQECEAPVHQLPMQIPQAAPQCPEHEEFHACGTACPATCAKPHPSPMCTKNCVVGCFCKEGYLRNARGVCVETRECEATQPNMLFAYPPELSECKENEMFMRCGTACPATCAKPHPSPMCTKNCVVGCFCKPGYLKNEQGVCVAAATCGVAPEDAMPMPPQVCDDNEEFRQCKGCDGTCKNPNPICPRICIPGCACKQGYLRSENGKCIQTRECSTPIVNMAMVESVEGKCATDREIYSECGTQLDCLASCGTPLPFLVHGYPQVPARCLERMCTPGCVCMKPYVRHSNGKCVERQECEIKNPFATMTTTTPSH